MIFFLKVVTLPQSAVSQSPCLRRLLAARGLAVPDKGPGTGELSDSRSSKEETTVRLVLQEAELIA